MLNRNVVTAIVFAASLFAWNAFAQTTSTTASQTLTFPVMAVAITETAQINVVNTATASSTTTAASCTGTIAFLDSAGATLSSTSFTLTPGQISSASRAYSTLGSTALRTLIRGTVTLTTATPSTTGTTTTPCTLGATMETYDTSTGVTHVLVSASGNQGSQVGGQPGGQPGGTQPGPSGGQQPPGTATSN